MPSVAEKVCDEKPAPEEQDGDAEDPSAPAYDRQGRVDSEWSCRLHGMHFGKSVNVDSTRYLQGTVAGRVSRARSLFWSGLGRQCSLPRVGP
jgi:hypothetical protein